MSFPPVNQSCPDAPDRFRAALATQGHAVLTDHPLAAETVDRVHDEWLAFFGTDAKHAYEAGTSRPDGYFPLPEDVPGNTTDRKEFFHVYPCGRYPAETSEAARRHFHDALTLARTLLEWLDEPDGARGLARMTEGSTATVLRIQRYLPARGHEPAHVPRALAHTDINLLTLMPAPTGPGLQVRHGDGWRDVTAPPGSLVVQAGEMLQLVTDGRYRAALHRVVHTGGRGDRMSLPLFVHPADAVELAPGLTAAAFRADRLARLRARGWHAVAGGQRRGDHA